MNIFEKATRLKLRFQSTRGMLTVEDLWDIELTSLDKLAIIYKKRLGRSESFLDTEDKDELTELSFELCKYIIEARLQEAKEKEDAKAAYDRKQKILSLISEKKDDELKGKSIEELQEMIN